MKKYLAGLLLLLFVSSFVSAQLFEVSEDALTRQDVINYGEAVKRDLQLWINAANKDSQLNENGRRYLTVRESRYIISKSNEAIKKIESIIGSIEVSDDIKSFENSLKEIENIEISSLKNVQTYLERRKGSQFRTIFSKSNKMIALLGEELDSIDDVPGAIMEMYQDLQDEIENAKKDWIEAKQIYKNGGKTQDSTVEAYGTFYKSTVDDLYNAKEIFLRIKEEMNLKALRSESMVFISAEASDDAAVVIQESIDRLNKIKDIVETEYDNGKGTLLKRHRDSAIEFLNKRIQTLEDKRDEILEFGFLFNLNEIQSIENSANKYIFESKDRLRKVLEDITLEIPSKLFAKMDRKEIQIKERVNLLKRANIDTFEIDETIEKFQSELKIAKNMYNQAREEYNKDVRSAIDSYYNYIKESRDHANNANTLMSKADKMISELMKNLLDNTTRKNSRLKSQGGII